jgi:ribulose-bisphosphate carboxylase large chain
MPAVQRAVAAANRETGGNTLYAPTFSGGTRALAEQTRIARECGVKMALVAPMLVGLPSFVEMQVELDIPVMAHPAFAGAGRIAPPLLLGKLFRLLGARRDDLPQPWRPLQLLARHLRGNRRCRAQPLARLRPHLPVPAGGMTRRTRTRDARRLRRRHDAAHRRQPAHAARAEVARARRREFRQSWSYRTR